MITKKAQQVVFGALATVLLVVPATSAFAESKMAELVAVESSTVLVDRVALEKARQLLQTETQKSYNVSKVHAQMKLKTIAALLRVGGYALELLLKPFSKKVAEKVVKYRTKAADALDALETWSKSKFVKGMVRLGVPQDVAESIAETLAFLLL